MILYFRPLDYFSACFTFSDWMFWSNGGILTYVDLLFVGQGNPTSFCIPSHERPSHMKNFSSLFLPTLVLLPTLEDLTLISFIIHRSCRRLLLCRFLVPLQANHNLPPREPNTLGVVTGTWANLGAMQTLTCWLNTFSKKIQPVALG